MALTRGEPTLIRNTHERPNQKTAPIQMAMKTRLVPRSGSLSTSRKGTAARIIDKPTGASFRSEETAPPSTLARIRIKAIFAGSEGCSRSGPSMNHRRDPDIEGAMISTANSINTARP